MIEVVGAVAVVAAVVTLGVVADRRFGILPRREQLRTSDDAAARRSRAQTFAAGEAPATALAPTTAALARLRTTPPRCVGDGAAMTNADDDVVRYAGRQLLVLRFRCPSCGAGRAIYCQTDRVQTSA